MSLVEATTQWEWALGNGHLRALGYKWVSATGKEQRFDANITQMAFSSKIAGLPDFFQSWLCSGASVAVFLFSLFQEWSGKGLKSYESIF